MATKHLPKTLQEAIVYFSDPDIAFAEMVKFRWPDGVVRRPTCGSKDVYSTEPRHIWQCKEKHAKRQLSVKVGSIMEDSPIGIDKWLIASWLISSAKNGISSTNSPRQSASLRSPLVHAPRIRLPMQDESGGRLADTSRLTRPTSAAKRATCTSAVDAASSRHWRHGKVAVMACSSVTARTHSTMRVSVVPDNQKTTLQPKFAKTSAVL